MKIVKRVFPFLLIREIIPGMFPASTIAFIKTKDYQKPGGCVSTRPQSRCISLAVPANASLKDIATGHAARNLPNVCRTMKFILQPAISSALVVRSPTPAVVSLKMRSKKSQASTEAMIIIAVVLFVFLGVYSIYKEKNGQLLLSGKELAERAACLQISGNIAEVYILGDGATISFKNQYDFILDPTPQRLESKHAFCRIPVSTISKNSSAPVMILPGVIQVRNSKGMISVTNI